jgi:hypothetical protein
VNAPFDHQGVPKPPADIWAELEAAGRDEDDVRLGIARSRYKASLEDQGIHTGAHGSSRPDGAVS